MRWLTALALAAPLLTGCLGARPIGFFGSHAFYTARDHYRVRYLDGDERRLLADGWDIENFEVGDDGVPDVARLDPPEAYMDSHALSSYVPMRREYAFSTERVELRYRREDGVSEIYARSLPLPPGWAEADVGLAMRRSVLSLGNPMARAPNVLGHQVPTGTVVHLRAEGRAEVDGQPGYYCVFDLIQTDRRTGEERVRRASVIGVRSEHSYRVRRYRLPMMVVFGLITSPSDHADLRPDFESLVSRVDFAPRR